jgi:hypothetical protein
MILFKIMHLPDEAPQSTLVHEPVISKISDLKDKEGPSGLGRT